MKMEENKEPFDVIIDNMKISGTFYTEHIDEAIKSFIESHYNPDLIRKYGIDKIIPTDKGYILKWYRRPWILTDSELTNKYGESYLVPYKQKSYLDEKKKASRQRGNKNPESDKGD